ncbi:putative membrane protein [Caulobacter sp. AP07]|uniref:stage II sporulation protein M n=1 Tax=Caulobacter sp. AP07 TaxID=1144304 RepID=UPI000271F818|nr:stage II sporulation protein M [Caulobacter sp. AP07]EJL23006.1 putative membrane protein [Caulobacter sp. AP07]
MAELHLKSYRFRAEREDDWRRLETLLAKVGKGSAKALSDEELLAMPVLYRQALSSLSVARATSLDQNLVDYLESLSTRAYFFVYGTRSSLVERLGGFFANEWPSAAKALWRETLFSFLLTQAGVAAAYFLTLHDPDWFSAFVPGDLANGRGPSASAEAMRATLYHKGGDNSGLSVFAAFLFTHNSGVAIFAFALGFAFCLPTAMLMAYNGCMLGAFLAAFGMKGLGFEAGGWLAIHGVTEIGAVILAGAAGLRIGWTLAFPGDLSRPAAMAQAGRQSATLMAGVVVMLFCAGILEGVGRQVIQNDFARYGIALVTLVLWPTYLYLPRRAKAVP